MKRHVSDSLLQVRFSVQVWLPRVHWTTKPLSKFAEQSHCGDQRFDVGELLLLLPQRRAINRDENRPL